MVKMVKRDKIPILSKNHWHTVAEFLLLDGADYWNQTAEVIAIVLMSFCIPDQIIVEVQWAVSQAIEKELSKALPIQAQQTFTIMIRAQQKQILEGPEHGSDSEKSHPRSRGWGFFLTEKRTSEPEAGYPMDHVVISIYLYQEG